MSLLSAIIGRPLASDEQDEQKIGVLAGVPAMGLDGLSSAAYGPEAALTILVPLGAVGLAYIGPIMLVILALLGMLYVSYRQTIAAYPQNGGSYTVARENLGTWPGLLAAAALMVDYILNVAVGISAGVAALVSVAPSLHKYTLPLCLGILALITLINLRGTGEAGMAFALPTYTFIASLSAVLILGIVKMIIAGGHPRAVDAPPPIPPGTEAVGLWLLLRAFASGCTAMTGVEAVSNGVSAFKKPTVATAHRTLTVIVVTLGFFLGGVALCTRAYGIGAMDQSQHGYQSVLSQLTAAVVGRGWFYYITLTSVLAALCLSANTSFVDFPRLSRLLAQDGFLPKWFALIGRRLVYSVGILFLAVAAGALLAVFGGITDRLIPLFAVGAFLAFTLSQAGMVIHWRRALRGGGAAEGADKPDHSPHRLHVRLWVNAAGAIATGAALVIILAAKFVEGAWITVLVIPLLLLLFRQTHRHYQRVVHEISTHEPLDLSRNNAPVVLVPMRTWDRLANKAMRFAFRLSGEVIGVHLCNVEGADCGDDEQRVRDQWAADVQGPAAAAGLAPPRLDMLQSPYRRFHRPLLAEIEKIGREYPDRKIAIVVSEVVGRHWWDALLHRRRASSLRRVLLQRCDRRVVVITVPWYLEE